MIRRRIAALAVFAALLAGGLFARTDRVVRADGRLAPKWWAQIRADGPGEVRARLKRQGDKVLANEAVALLEPEGEEAAVAAAEGDLAAAQQQFETVARRLDRMADYSVVVPPPSVLDLGAWLQEQVKNRAPRALLVTGATERMQSIRTEFQARAALLHRASPGSRPPEPVSRRPGGAIEARLARREEQVLDALRLSLSTGSYLSLDQALAGYEDAIFEGLCDLAGVLPPVVRDAFAAGGPIAAPGEPGQGQGAAGLRSPEGYFELQSQLRRTQLELRQLETEATNLARLREVLPALAGARHGELKALRQALEELVARSQESRRRRDDGLGPVAGRLRTEIHGTGEALLEGVDGAWARIDEGSGSGLADLARQVSQLRLSFSALERALDRQLAAISSHSQGLIARNTLEDQSASAEQQARIFLDAAEGLRISAVELLGKRVGEVELAVVQRQHALEVLRARLRQVMAAGDSALSSNEPRPLEAARDRYASAVARAEWALKAARLALEAKVVRAPADGVITSVGLQERTTVGRNEVVGIVENLDGLVFKAMVPERELSGVAVGQQVHLSIDLGDHRQAVEGRVSWIGRDGLVIDNAERSWNVLVAVEGNSATLMPPFMPGLGGRAEIVLGRTTGLERLRELMRPSPPLVRRYLNPELPDPTQVLRARPEPTAPQPRETGAGDRSAPKLTRAQTNETR